MRHGTMLHYHELMFYYYKRKKKENGREIWLSPMLQAPTPTEKSKKQHYNIKNAPKLW